MLVIFLIEQNSIPYRACLPSLPGTGFYTSLVKLPRHRSKGEPTRNHVLYDRVDLRGKRIRRPHIRPRRFPALQAGISELHAPEFGLRHCRPGALGNHGALMLRHGRENVDGKAGCLRHIDGQEVHPAIH